MGIEIQKRKLKNMYIFLNAFKNMFEINSSNGVPNCYEKRKIESMIGSAFGVSDPRSIKPKLDWAKNNKIILVGVRGHSINPTIIDFFNEFVEKNKNDLENIDMLEDF
jgi:hypothetical protein